MVERFKYKEVYILLLCWIFWAIAQGYSWYNVAPDINILTIIKVRAIQLSVAFGFNIIFILIVKCINKYFLKKALRYILAFISLLIVSYVLVIINSSAFRFLVMGEVINLGFASYTAYALAKFIFIGGFTTLFFLLKYDKRFRNQEIKLLEAQDLAKEARLTMLRYQLNPHFLFNTLNSIRSLVSSNGEKARKMITELSEFLRSVLLYKENTETTIKHEIEIVRSYINIQQIRFSDDLIFNEDIDTDLLDTKVPCFILQPIIENSIKYGMETSPIPLKINLRLQKDKGHIILSVVNTGKLKEPDCNNSSNTGISNIKKRLHLFYNSSGVFSLTQHNNQVEAKIVINDK